MDSIFDPTVAQVFNSYPDDVRRKMLRLREIVVETASDIAGKENVTETLKWGEPSYLVPGGSTLRIDWKPSAPDHCAVYFHCQTTLVDTFKELYPEEFQFQGNRAILLRLDEDVPIDKLKHCMALCFRYHSVKRLPMLGA